MKNKPGKPQELTDLVRQLLLAEHIGTQEELIQRLKQQGHHVNQSKVSRILRKLGAIRTSSDQHYSLPQEPAPPAARNIFPHLIVDISHNETLIIIRTNPGSASLIARVLDHHGQELGILGTVAGDDTIFVAPCTIRNIQLLTEKINHFLVEIK
jgi:transcriptional regulator of arginine metabolism